MEGRSVFFGGPAKVVSGKTNPEQQNGTKKVDP